MFGNKKSKQENLLKKQQKQEIKIAKKEKAAKLKKKSGMKAVRIFVWTVIVFIIVRGTVTLIKGDPLQEMENKQIIYAEKLQDENKINRKVFGFAENFIEKYYSYSEEKKDDYAEQLENYISKDAIRDIDIKGESIVSLAKGYDIQKYSDNQLDVYIYIELSRQVEDEASTEREKKYKYINEEIYVKVPIYIEADTQNMIVEDVPLIVGKPDSAVLPEDDGFGLDEVTGSTANKISDSIEEFLKVYYTSNQTQVDYFLSEAGKIKAATIDEQFEFEKINECKVIRLDVDTYLATVEYFVKDNGVSMKQRINIKLKNVNNKYVIDEMNTRCKNLNIDSSDDSNKGDNDE